jgi:CheY-like chemotaxis protein
VDQNASGEPLTGVRLLLVDDNDDSREMCAEFLSSVGAEVVEAPSGNEAWRAFERELPHIVVSDLQMPDGDGFELVQRIRALPGDAGGLTPAIAVSGTDASREAILGGFHALIMKPIDPTLLVEMLADFAGETGVTSNRHEVLKPRPGVVVLRWKGHVHGSHIRSAMKVVVEQLSRGPCIIVSDLRGVAGFAWSVASAAETAVWSHRRAIQHVYLVGGSRAAQLVSMGGCKVLGLPCTVVEDMPREALLG